MFPHWKWDTHSASSNTHQKSLPSRMFNLKKWMCTDDGKCYIFSAFKHKFTQKYLSFLDTQMWKYILHSYPPLVLYCFRQKYLLKYFKLEVIIDMTKKKKKKH